MKRLVIALPSLFIGTGSLFAQLDGNANGMSDLWERHFNQGQLFGPGFTATGDQDGDGQNNLAEAISGTDPLKFDPPEGQLVQTIRHVPATWGQEPGQNEPVLLTPEAFEIQWQAVTGKRYTLAFSPDLEAGNWLPVGGPINADVGGPILIGCLPDAGGGQMPDKLFWRVQAGDIDQDGDGLNDYEEHLLGTYYWAQETYPGFPDLWLATHYPSAQGFDPDADDDSDGLTNFEEYLNGSDPHHADSDGDGTTDAAEVNEGSNPHDPTDGGAPPVDPLEEVDFTVGGDYAYWRMEIQGQGPRDNRLLRVASQFPGDTATRALKLQRNNKYEITLHRVGGFQDWYCWEAGCGGQPSAPTFDAGQGWYQLGPRNQNARFFGVADHWLADNRDGLLTQHLDSYEYDVASGLKAVLLPTLLLSDVDNNGQIAENDAVLSREAFATGATEETADNGTEFLLANDQMSNGIWDVEDASPLKPATEKNDDDVERLKIEPGITEGEVWLEHPAISSLSFYKSRECKPADKINLSSTSKFALTAQNPLPGEIFGRAESVVFTNPNDPQVTGDLVLKLKFDEQEIEVAKLRFTVVKDLGAKKYFHAVRDYIFENNTKIFTHHKDYGNTTYRIVAMREESTAMFAFDSYNHTEDKPGPMGLDAVKANFDSDVIINGNQCFFSGIPFFGGMTDRCDGRLCVGRQILRPPSDDTHNPNLGGPGARYVGYTMGEPTIENGRIVVPSIYSFATGQVPEGVPATPDQGIGGLAAKYDRAELQQSENQAIGRARVTQPGKGIVFTATTYVGNQGNAISFAADAGNSGVQPLAGGAAGAMELLFLDGSSSVGLVARNPDGNQQTIIKGSKHDGNFYYINTYLMFECEKPRN